MNRVLHNCYDSHVHWQATGEYASRLDLSSLKSPEDVKTLNVEPQHFRGDWLTGWGWDQNHWPSQNFPELSILDQAFPNHPVFFVRADGHAVWVNSKALAQIPSTKLDRFSSDSKGGRVLRDERGRPTGVLLDHAMALVQDVLPKIESASVRNSLLDGIKIFNQNGFTHIRDLTCNVDQWSEARRLEDENKLTLAVEQFFDADPFDRFDRALLDAEKARQDQSRLLRVKGIKIFYDGALGSEGALLSHSYRSGESGLRLLSLEQFTEGARRTWEKHFDLAIHVIGDQAAHEVALKACELWDQGLQGHLHLEHAELLRPETIQLLKGRRVTCHIQPCHWLTDRHWLNEKVGDLAKHAFPWAELQENKINFHFGSDSPIEPPRLQSTLEALEESQQSGIKALKGDPLAFHEHPDLDWTPHTHTELKDGKVSHVQFLGRSIS